MLKKFLLSALILLLMAMPAMAAQVNYSVENGSSQLFTGFVSITVIPLPFNYDNRISLSLSNVNNFKTSKQLPVGEYQVQVHLMDSHGEEIFDWVVDFQEKLLIGTEDQVYEAKVLVQKYDNPFAPPPEAESDEDVYMLEERPEGLVVVSANPEASLNYDGGFEGRKITTPTPSKSGDAPQGSGGDDGAPVENVKKDMWKSLFLGLGFFLIFVGVVIAWRKIMKMRGGGFKD